MSARRTLSLRGAGPAAAPEALIRVAIAQKVCVRATYNRTAIRLAPHALYTRHDEWFVDGVVLKRDGQPPRELKLGTFKLIGLGEIGLAPAPFHAQPFFDPASPKYAGDAVLVEPA